MGKGDICVLLLHDFIENSKTILQAYYEISFLTFVVPAAFCKKLLHCVIISSMVYNMGTNLKSIQ